MTTAVVTITPADITAHREQLCEWAKANGLNPHDIPPTHPIRVEDGKGGPIIRYRHFVYDEHGRQQRHPEKPDEVWTVEATAPCTVPPPHLDTPTPHAHPEAST